MKDQTVNRLTLIALLIWCFAMAFLIYSGMRESTSEISKTLQSTKAATSACSAISSETTKTIEGIETTRPTERIEYIEETQPITAETIRSEEFEEFWHEPAVYMAKTLWGEARGCSVEQQQMVAWCILNRVDSYDFPETIIGVIIQPNQFHGYSSDFPCTDELYEVSMDVIAQWQAEKNGGTSNRNLGPEYLYFCANSDGTGNVFRKQW